jgi:hypothetical protein
MISLGLTVDVVGQITVPDYEGFNEYRQKLALPIAC